MYNKIREWAYATYGKATVDVKGQVTGNLRINKLSTLALYGEAGWMDMCFWVKGAHVFLIELKAPGKLKEQSELQAQREKELKALGFHVYLTDGIEKAKVIAKKEIDDALRRFK